MFPEVFNRNKSIFGQFENLDFRQACKNDIAFIIEAIIASEKSGRDKISTCKIFGLTEEEYKKILSTVLLEDIGDYEYNLPGFLIAENNGEYIGVSGSWIECLDGTSSGIKKSSIFTPYLSGDNKTKFQNNFNIINSLTIIREPMTCQLEYVYIRNKYRKHGIFSALIAENIKRNHKRYPFLKVQTLLYNGNEASYCAHLKFGFEVSETKSNDDINIYNYFPYNSRVLMELPYEKIHSL